MADIDEKERQRQDISNIRYLHLLRGMIHNEIMFINPDARKGHDPALFKKYIASYVAQYLICVLLNLLCTYYDYRQSGRLQSVQDRIQSFGNTVKRV